MTRAVESAGFMSNVCVNSTLMASGLALRVVPWLGRALAARPAPAWHRSQAVRARRVRRECPQALARTDDDSGLLLVDGARIGVPGDAKVLMRPASVFVADVAFAHVAGHDQDFLGRVKQP
jgi:hypothetical protein